MREKIMRLSKPAVLLVVFVTAVFFLGLMDIIGAVTGKMVSLSGYGNSMMAEFFSGVFAVVFLLVFGYGFVLLDKGKGILQGLFIGGFLNAYCLLELVAQIYVQVINKPSHFVSAAEIFYFVMTMFLIGFTEEILFRGVILNLCLDCFSNTAVGILGAIIWNGIIFGVMHLNNIFHGVSVESAMIQAVNAAFLGVLLAAIYVRSKNIWLVILYHALIDFVGLMGSGLFGVATSAEQINEMSPVNLVAVPLFVIPCFVLLRPKKLRELEQEKNHMVVFDSYEEVQNNAVTSLVLGIFSIIIGLTGYGIGIGLTGLIGGILSKKMQREQNGMAVAGMILSVVGMIVSVVAALFWVIIFVKFDIF